MSGALGSLLGLRLGRLFGLNLCARSTFAGDPSTILAAGEQKAWYRADQGITLNGSTVSSWANIWGNGDMVQGTATAQPVFSATGMNGLPCVQNIDTVRMMRCSPLPVLIPSGIRVYFWLYMRTDVHPVGSTRRWASVTGSTGGQPYLRATNGAAGKFRADYSNAAGDVPVFDSDISTDLQRRLLEVGFTTNGENCLVVSGTPFSAPSTIGPLGAAQGSIAIFSSGSSAVNVGVNASIAEFIVMLGEPTQQQKLDMRAYFQTRYGTLGG